MKEAEEEKEEEVIVVVVAALSEMNYPFLRIRKISFDATKQSLKTSKQSSYSFKKGVRTADPLKLTSNHFSLCYLFYSIQYDYI